jgi:hypothetical protein
MTEEIESPGGWPYFIIGDLAILVFVLLVFSVPFHLVQGPRLLCPNPRVGYFSGYLAVRYIEACCFVHGYYSAAAARLRSMGEWILGTTKGCADDKQIQVASAYDYIFRVQSVPCVAWRTAVTGFKCLMDVTLVGCDNKFDPDYVMHENNYTCMAHVCAMWSGTTPDDPFKMFKCH